MQNKSQRVTHLKTCDPEPPHDPVEEQTHLFPCDVAGLAKLRLSAAG